MSLMRLIYVPQVSYMHTLAGQQRRRDIVALILSYGHLHFVPH
jgi:hypothetical protein